MPPNKRLERDVEKTSTRQVEAINRYQRAKNRKIHKHTHVLALSACLQPWPVSRTRSPVISTHTGCEAYCYWQSHHSCRRHTLIASHFTLLSLSILSAFFSLFPSPFLFANIVSPQITATVLSHQLCKRSLRFHPRISHFRSKRVSPQILQGGWISQISTLRSCSSIRWMIRQWHPSFYCRQNSQSAVAVSRPDKHHEEEAEEEKEEEEDDFFF